MKLTRRDAMALGLGSTAASFLPGSASACSAQMAEAAASRDLPAMPSEYQSTGPVLRMADVMATARTEAKDVMVLMQQVGCADCEKLHSVNLARPDVSDFVRNNFVVLSLDIWGTRVIEDFDGEVLKERTIARKWGVNLTPGTVLIATTGRVPGSFADAEVFHMPGYLEPFHYLASLRYVAEDAYVGQSFAEYYAAQTIGLIGANPDLS